MRIVTFNVQHARTPTGRVDTAALTQHCASFGAHVLALQEVDAGVRRSGRVHQAAAVARATGMTGVFAPARSVGMRGRYGNALLVHGGVEDVETVFLPRVRGRERRVAALATAVVADRRISVAATHLSVLRSEAAGQLEAVLDALARRPAPRLLLGDLNLRPPWAVPALEARGYAVADTTAPTYPASGPFLRIDHVAVDGLDLTAVEVLDGGPVSDHRPLQVEVG